jgi:hypothetical protein
LDEDGFQPVDFGGDCPRAQAAHLADRGGFEPFEIQNHDLAIGRRERLDETSQAIEGLAISDDRLRVRLCGVAARGDLVEGRQPPRPPTT